MKNLILLIAAIFALVSCEANFAGEGLVESSSSSSGSYANMLIVDDHMYIIDSRNLQTFNVSDAENPQLVDETDVGFNIESLLYYKGKLFIGSPTAMYIYELNNQKVPVKTSVTDYEFFGAEFCQRDPIAVNDQYAFTSLSSVVVSECGNFNAFNEVRIFNIEDLENVRHINTIPMESPKGIGLDGNHLFVCEQTNGIKVYDISDVGSPQMLHHFSGYNAYDLIARDGLLIVVGEKKLYEYDYNNIEDMSLLGTFDY